MINVGKYGQLVDLADLQDSQIIAEDHITVNPNARFSLSAAIREIDSKSETGACFTALRLWVCDRTTEKHMFVAKEFDDVYDQNPPGIADLTIKVEDIFSDDSDPVDYVNHLLAAILAQQAKLEIHDNHDGTVEFVLTVGTFVTVVEYMKGALKGVLTFS